jgi:hypothetical protein
MKNLASSNDEASSVAALNSVHLLPSWHLQFDRNDSYSSTGLIIDVNDDGERNEYDVH